MKGFSIVVQAGAIIPVSNETGLTFKDDCCNWFTHVFSFDFLGAFPESSTKGALMYCTFFLAKVYCTATHTEKLGAICQDFSERIADRQLFRFSPQAT